MYKLLLVVIAAMFGSVIAFAQTHHRVGSSIIGGGGGGAPGAPTGTLQFNTNSTFGGISGVTSDSANVGFATSSQLILYGQTAGNCLTVNSSFAVISQSCSAGSQTSIAAGTNITTSGTAGNVTVNVLSNPSFTTVIASGNITAGTAQFTGATTGTTAQFQTYTGTQINLSGTASITASTIQLSGLLTGTQANFSALTVQGLSGCVQATGAGQFLTPNGNCATQTSIAAGSNITTSGTVANTTVNVVATPSFTTVIATGNLTATTAQFTGWVTAPGIAMQTATIAGNLTGSTGNFSGNLTGTTAQFTGQVTGTSAVFQTVTVSNLTPTGPNCLQETGGVLQATNVACATQVATISIAQGNNIVTSGTAANITVTATPTGASNTVQFNNAGVFGGDVGFQYAGGTTGIVTHTLGPGNLTTTNSKALSIIGTLSSGTVQFNPPFFMNITTNAFASGTKIVDIQGSGISYLSVFASTGMTVLGNITGTTGQITGWLTGPGANFQSATIAGALIGSTGNFSSNLTASTVLGVVGWLTAPGVNMQTATLAGALIGTSGNFSTNLTANIAQFAGFMSAGGASLSGLTIQTETLSSNLTGTTANFSSNLTANIAQFAGFLSAGGASLSGLTIQTETLSSNLTGTTANFSSNLTGQIAAFPGFLTASGANFNSVTIVNSLTGSTGNFTSTLTASIYTGTGTGAGTLSFITPGVAQFATGGTAATNNGWTNWGGESRLATDKGLNISNAGLTPTGLSVNVAGGRNYSIDADLYVTLAVAATSGIAVSLSGTYGSTDTHYFGYVVDGGSNTSAAGTSNPIRGATLATAKNTIVGNVSLSGTTGYVSVKGTVSVSAPGTLLIAAATVNTQTAANGVTLTRGSRILVQDMP